MKGKEKRERGGESMNFSWKDALLFSNGKPKELFSLLFSL